MGGTKWIQFLPQAYWFMLLLDVTLKSVEFPLGVKQISTNQNRREIKTIKNKQSTSKTKWK